MLAQIGEYIGLYFTEVGKVQLLTGEEEKTLGRKMGSWRTARKKLLNLYKEKTDPTDRQKLKDLLAGKTRVWKLTDEDLFSDKNPGRRRSKK